MKDTSLGEMTIRAVSQTKCQLSDEFLLDRADRWEREQSRWEREQSMRCSGVISAKFDWRTS